MTMPPPANRPTANAANDPGPLARFFGGRPSSVIFKLILLSILVGFILKVLGLDPFNIIRSIRELFDAIWNMGFDAVITLGRYFLLGAVLVIPIWLIIRLVRTPRGR
jgi:Family of unknown function (DUF6460)